MHWEIFLKSTRCYQTYQHVQVTQLLPNGSDKNYAIVWNDRKMGPEVREVTFDGTIMNSWNNYKIRITLARLPKF